jgi:hypothetical protein
MAGFCGSVRLKNLPHDRGFSGSRFDFRSNERLANRQDTTGLQLVVLQLQSYKQPPSESLGTPPGFSRWYFNFKAKDYLSLHCRLNNVGS